VTDHGNGSYMASTVMRLAGTYAVYGMLGDRPVPGTPFHVSCTPGLASGPNCVITGTPHSARPA
jgi:hypothetical protein